MSLPRTGTSKRTVYWIEDTGSVRTSNKQRRMTKIGGKKKLEKREVGGEKMMSKRKQMGREKEENTHREM